jgi:hypothetical protein
MSDEYTTDSGAPSTPSPVRRPKPDRARLVRVAGVVWTAAMLIAVVTGAVLNFVEASRACTRGLAGAGSGWSEVTFHSSIAVTCHARGGTFEIPLNGAAAVVLFGGLGLVGIVVFVIWHQFVQD